MVDKIYLKVLGLKRVSQGPRLAKGDKRSKVDKRYLKVESWKKKIPKDQRFVKSFYRSMAGNG